MSSACCLLLKVACCTRGTLSHKALSVSWKLTPFLHLLSTILSYREHNFGHGVAKANNGNYPLFRQLLMFSLDYKTTKFRTRPISLSKQVIFMISLCQQSLNVVFSRNTFMNLNDYLVFNQFLLNF